MNRLTPLFAVGSVATLSVLAGLAHGAPSAPAAPKPATGGRLSAQDAAQLEERFTQEIWPLLDRANGGCVACHGANNPSQLHFAADGAGFNFKKLLGHGFFDPENPSGLLARITTAVDEQRMDPAYDPHTGELKPNARKDPKSFIPNHGDVYATALHLADIDPKGRGRNDRPPLKFIKKGS